MTDVEDGIRWRVRRKSVSDLFIGPTGTCLARVHSHRYFAGVALVGVKRVPDGVVGLRRRSQRECDSAKKESHFPVPSGIGAC